MSQFEQFKIKSQQEGAALYRAEIQGNGGFDYSQQVNSLIELNNKLNLSLLTYLFGEKLGKHYMEKFAINCKRDFLRFIGGIGSEERFFILHELKTNKTLFAHC